PSRRAQQRPNGFNVSPPMRPSNRFTLPLLLLLTVFVYAVIGFAALFIIGACFVLTAGFSHSAVTTTPKNSILGGSYRGGRGNEPNVIATLFNRLKRSNGRGSRLRGSHYEYKPHRHLDSSLDTEEEDELYSRKVTIADTQVSLNEPEALKLLLVCVAEKTSS